MSHDAFPVIDARTQPCLTDQQAEFFKANGLLVIRNLLRGAELEAMRAQTLPLVQKANASRVADADFLYQKHSITGQEVPFRVEYVIDKCPAAKALLGHPFILQSVQKIQGPNFIPTWDSMVFKNQGGGVAIAWHRDAGDGNGATEAPLFNVDFYLDSSDMSNCLWGILGSHRWPVARAAEVIGRLNQGGFQTAEGAVPILMNPGDVIFHNILALHGSPAAQSQLRRVVYYEFRPAEIETRHGPHTPQYLPLKQKMLQACLGHRAAADYAAGEERFSYQPTGAFAVAPSAAEAPLTTYRYPHEKYWRG